MESKSIVSTGAEWAYTAISGQHLLPTMAVAVLTLKARTHSWSCHFQTRIINDRLLLARICPCMC